MPEDTLVMDDLLHCAIEHHQSGRLAQAGELYGAVLTADPGHPDALHLSGVLAQQVGDSELALKMIDSAIRQSPRAGAYHTSRGLVLQARGELAASAAAYGMAVALDPSDAGAAAGRVEVAALITERSRLQAYQASVDELRRSPYMDFPAHVHLETQAVCNADCSFCPSSALRRSGVKMPDALIAKVIDDLTAIPRTLSFQLSPFKVNEPLLDVRLFDILALCNDKLPNASLTLTTNASPLTEAKLSQLARVKNLSYLWISFNDHRPAVYEKVMRLPYQRTIERLSMLHGKKASGEFAPRVVVSRVGDGTSDDAEFATWVRRQFPLFDVSVFQRGSWIGQVDTAVGAVPAVGCARWFELSITSTGTVAHCCMDGQADWPIGDVQKQHVLDIYNAPEYRALRERTASRRDVSPCRQCTFL